MLVKFGNEMELGLIKYTINFGTIVFTIVLLSGCLPLGPAKPGQAPNSIQRSTILSANDRGITIEHSTWGKPIAFETADKHCASKGLQAVYQGASQQYSPDVISTWVCE